MLQPASRVIGIIRIAETSKFRVDLSMGRDDSTLGALLAGLVGKQSEPVDVGCRRSRWQPRASFLPRVCARSVMRANLAHLHEDLKREYLELTAS